MDFAPSQRAAELTDRVRAFMRDEIEPVEDGYHREIARLRSGGDPWTQLPLLGELRDAARDEGLWNLFLPRRARRRLRASGSAPPAARGSATSTTRRSPS